MRYLKKALLYSRPLIQRFKELIIDISQTQCQELEK